MENLSFIRLWQQATAGDRANVSAVREVVDQFADVFDIEVTGGEQIGQSLFFLLDLSRLDFRGMDVNVMMVTRPAEDERAAKEQASALIEYRDASDAQGFCFHLVLADGPGAPNPHIPRQLECVTLHRTELEEIFRARFPDKAFFQIIRHQHEIDHLNPYTTTVEARGPMFYGRQEELSRLTGDERTAFLISGARRVGKSSLVMRAYRLMRTDREFRDRAFYFDCRNWKRVNDGVHWLAHKIDPRREARITKGTQNVTNMLSNRSGRGRRPLILFFDEIDGVIDWDGPRDWHFMSLLREACTQGWVGRIVFVGFRSTARLIASGYAHPDAGAAERSPFYGALEEMRLGPLTKDEVRRLVTEPLTRQEIAIQSAKQIVSAVWRSTRGFPYLVQFYGQEFFKLATNRTPRAVRADDATNVENGSLLRDLLMNQFLINTRIGEQPRHTERYAAFHLAHLGEGASQHDYEILKGLAETGVAPGMDDLQSSLQNLVMANILIEDERGYRFALPALGKVLRTKYPSMQTVLLALPPQ